MSRTIFCTFLQREAEGQDFQLYPGSLLINASRGTVVDIPALCDALASKHLAGAAAHWSG